LGTIIGHAFVAKFENFEAKIFKKDDVYMKYKRKNFLKICSQNFQIAAETMSDDSP